MKSRGYTLVELLVVLAVLAVLASITLPLAEMSVQRDKERELKRALWEIRDALDAYRTASQQGAIGGLAATRSGYPPDLQSLTLSYRDNRPQTAGQPMRFLRRVPRDPFADPAVPAEKSWGLRSYLSEPGNPQPGDDVYDVFSKATTVGLNGVPLRQW